MKTAQRKALIIGISDYTNLQKLDFCKNDGTEIYQVLSSLGYEISDKNKLVGEAKGEKVKDAIYDFFDDIRNIPDDTLLFYYSGHGVPDIDGDMYLASSDTDPDKPYRRGFSFEELTKMIQKSISTSVVVILDCCYSGSAKVSKGHEEDAAKIGSTAIDEKFRKLPQGQGKYILSASQAAQEAYALETWEHSIFTYYLLQGLRGNTESVDSEGNVTPQSLGKYVYRAIMSLPADKRPKQKPITRAEESGDVILAFYPELTRKPLDPVTTTTTDTKNGVPLSLSSPIKERKKKYLLLISLSVAALVGIIVIVLISITIQHQAPLPSASSVALQNKGAALAALQYYSQAIRYYDKALAIDPNYKLALQNKGAALANLGNYSQAIRYYDKALAIDPNDKFVLANKQIALEFKGNALANLGNYTQAIQYYDKALAIDPNYANALNGKGKALANLGKYTQAIQYYDKALAIDPNYKVALENKGNALTSLGNYKQAIKYYDKAVAINPRDNYALDRTAADLGTSGNWTGAMKYANKALAIDPNDKSALTTKTNALNGLKNTNNQSTLSSSS